MKQMLNGSSNCIKWLAMGGTHRRGGAENAGEGCQKRRFTPLHREDMYNVFIILRKKNDYTFKTTLREMKGYGKAKGI